MFIDIHVHVTRLACPRRIDGKPWFATPEQLLARYGAIGVDKAVLLPDVSPECNYMPQSNEDIFDICAAFPERFIPFCNIDPRAISNSVDADLGHLVNHYRELGCKGLGEVTANLPFYHPMVRNLFGHVERAGLPLTFHISPEIGNNYGLYDEPGLPGLERALAQFPGLRFLGHSQAFWAEMAPLETPGDRWGYPEYPIHAEGVVQKLMRRYGNLYGDLSAGSGYNALARDTGYAAAFLDEFQDRLLFGTDICAPDTETPLVDFLLGMRGRGEISEEVFRKVARENAEKLLGLEE